MKSEGPNSDPRNVAIWDPKMGPIWDPKMGPYLGPHLALFGTQYRLYGPLRGLGQGPNLGHIWDPQMDLFWTLFWTPKWDHFWTPILTTFVQNLIRTRSGSETPDDPF